MLYDIKILGYINIKHQNERLNSNTNVQHATRQRQCVCDIVNCDVNRAKQKAEVRQAIDAQSIFIDCRRRSNAQKFVTLTLRGRVILQSKNKTSRVNTIITTNNQYFKNATSQQLTVVSCPIYNCNKPNCTYLPRSPLTKRVWLDVDNHWLDLFLQLCQESFGDCSHSLLNKRSEQIYVNKPFSNIIFFYTFKTLQKLKLCSINLLNGETYSNND